MRARTVLTVLAVLMAFTVVVASAVIRHVQAGFGCTPWPACYGTSSAMTAAAASNEVHLARAAHRVAAGAVSVLIVILLGGAWRRWRQPDLHIRSMVWALAIALALALVGAMTVGSRLPGVTLLNLLGGFALLAALSAALGAGSKGLDSPSPIRIAALCMLVLVFVQASIGGMIGAQFAAPVCAQAAGCEPWTWAEGLTGGAWNPWRLPMLADGAIAPPPGASMLHAMHRTLSVVVVLGLLLVASLAYERWPRAAWVLGAIAVAEPVLGIVTAGPHARLAVVLAHHILAACLVAALAALAAMSHSPAATAIAARCASRAG